MVKKLAIFFLFLTTLSSCSKKCKEEIPDTYFTQEDLDLIPYPSFASVTFVNDSGDTRIFTAGEYIYQGVYIDENNCPNEYSEIYQLIFSCPDVDYDIWYTTRFWNGSATSEGFVGLEMSLRNDANSYDVYVDYNAEPDIHISSPDHASLTLNNSSYTEVYQLWSDYMMLYYNKEYGVVGLVEGDCCDQNELMTWSLEI